MTGYLWVGIGGALGSIARFWCSGMVARHFGETFPWGTFVVNVLGSFLIGFFSTLTGPDSRWLVPPSARQFVMIGVCGGYTTFSSFSLQTVTLAQNGEWFRMSSNVLISVTFCLIGTWLGSLLAANLSIIKGT